MVETAKASFIVVTRNTLKATLRCLESIYATWPRAWGNAFEVFVVDNASTDGTPGEIRRRFPLARVMENPSNLGFAAANNRALKAAQGRYLFFVNSDVQLGPGAIQTLIEFMEMNPSVGLAGPQLYNENGTKANSIANFPSFMTEFVNKSLLRLLFPRKFPSKYVNYTSPLEVESVIGACMIARTAAVEAVGGLDETFFLFLEETDWCLRMRQAGWRVCHVPEARVIHQCGETAKAAPNYRARIEYTRSLFAFVRKHFSRPAYLAFRGLHLAKVSMQVGLFGLANVLSFFSIPWLRERLGLAATLLLWQTTFCPSSWGLSESAKERHPARQTATGCLPAAE